MSSSEQVTSSPPNFQLIVGALADYAKLTGIDLSKCPFSEKLKLSNSPQVVLELLEEREKSFKDYRDRNRRLIGCIGPAVKVLHALSGTLGGVVGSVPFPPAIAVFAGIDALLAAATGITSSYDALLDLFECLGNFLKRLEVYTAIPPTPLMTDIVVKILVELLSVLALATTQIKQGRFKKFTKKLLRESEVESVLTKLDRLTAEEARMTVAQTLGVVHGLVGSVRVVMEDGRASTDSIRRDLVALHEMLNEMNKMKRVQLQRDVRDWLSPPDPSTNHDFVWNTHLEGTAAWFLESDLFEEWKATGSLLWIHGKPGSGKSTLLSAIIQGIQDIHAAGLATMAYYYFDFRDTKKQDRYGLLSSLLSQLSAESDLCYEILSQLYVDNAGGTRKPTRSALFKCLKDMLSLPGQGQIYLIVDGLDECPNLSGTPSAREEVLDFIEELVDLELPNVRLCVTSRPEIDIRTMLEPLTSLKISLHDEIGQKEDILQYIKFVVRSDRRMRRWKEEDKRLVVDTLSDKTDGMFRWVVCQVDTLRRSFPASIRSVLDDLPKTLDETYGRTLLGIDEEKREFARRLFRCLMVSSRPLQVEELAEILAFRFHEAAPPTFNVAWRAEDAEEAVMSACCCLIAIIRRGGRNVVQFSHFSVKEYLTSERLAAAEEHLSYYHILPEPAHTTLAHASISVLLQLDDKIDKDAISHFPLALYAAQYWTDHARFKDVPTRIQHVMECLFDGTKPHFAAWVWLYGYRPALDAPDTTRGYVNIRGGFYVTPLHAASVKGHSEVASLLLKNGADINSRDDRGCVPLHKVSQGGHLIMVESSTEVARLLINSNANVNVTNNEGWTPLHMAARYGYCGVAQLLLGSGASPDVRDKCQRTPLRVACVYGKLDVSHCLADCGADLNSRDYEGVTPLHAASHYSYVDVARLLLNRGADVNAEDQEGRTPLYTASRLGHPDLAQLLIDNGANVNVRNIKGLTPLHFASKAGYLNFARLLIINGGDVNAHETNDPTNNCVGWTPLHFASGFGHLNLARLLIDSGADVNVHEIVRGLTPLHLALRHPDLARLLIDNGADVNAHNVDRWTSLHLASGGGHLDITRLLIQHGGIVDSRADKGETPLSVASHYGYLEIARLLFEHGAVVSSQDDRGFTPFHWAWISGNLHVAKFLLECGIDVDIRNENEDTSLFTASANGRLEAVRFLIDHGADTNVKNNKGWYPLHVASSEGHLDAIRLLLDSGIPTDFRNETQQTPLAVAACLGKVEAIRFLIERGADMNSRTNKGWAPLHSASRRGQLDVVRLLLDHGVDVNVQKDDLWSPLHLASANDHLKVAQLLIQRGAVVDMFDDSHRTPLVHAAESGNVEITRLLIDNGANLHSTDSNGWTPLHSASYSGHLGVVKLLLGWGTDVNVLNKANQTAAELASKNGKAEVATFLAEYRVDINVQHDTCSTPLDTAQCDADEGGKVEKKVSLGDASEDAQVVDTLNSLLKLGADMKYINPGGAGNRSLLHLSAAQGRVKIVRFLIEQAGADVDLRDENGRTPLHYTSRYGGHVEVARVLVDHGANVNAREEYHLTPLHLSASYGGHIEFVKLLLEGGADVHALDNEGQSPYERSLKQGRREIEDLLREHGAGGASPKRI